MGTALITGASSGLGEEFAWQLAERGHDVVLVARRQDRLECLANQLTQIAGVGAEVLPADLATPAGRAAVSARLHQAGRPVGLLVNNAGFGLGQPFVGGTLARELQGLAVMVVAVLELSHAAAQAMVARGRGAILNVSSMTASTAMGTYAAHKAWVRSFTEGLAEELRGTGVGASAVLPGLVRTEFHETANMHIAEAPAWTWLSAQQVVADALRAVARRQVLVTPSVSYKVLAGALRVAPRSLVRRLSNRSLYGR